MGTVFSIDVRTPGVDPRALDNVVDWLHHVDRTFSTYRPDSPISRLARGDLDPMQCSAEVLKILTRCEELEHETDGYFSAYATGSLDPSGLVKGWAIERASNLLRDAGSTNHAVNGGGDVQCAGDTGSGEAWRIGVAHPLRPRELAGVVVGSDLAVATSGLAERGDHIIDPHTGRSPQVLASVTLIGQRLSQTDAYATAAYAMGTDARDWIQELPAHWGFTITADGQHWSSRQLGPQHVQPLPTQPQVHATPTPTTTEECREPPPFWRVSTRTG